MGAWTVKCHGRFQKAQTVCDSEISSSVRAAGGALSLFVIKLYTLSLILHSKGIWPYGAHTDTLTSTYSRQQRRDQFSKGQTGLHLRASTAAPQWTDTTAALTSFHFGPTQLEVLVWSVCLWLCDVAFLKCEHFSTTSWAVVEEETTRWQCRQDFWPGEPLNKYIFAIPTFYFLVWEKLLLCPCCYYYFIATGFYLVVLKIFLSSGAEVFNWSKYLPFYVHFREQFCGFSRKSLNCLLCLDSFILWNLKILSLLTFLLKFGSFLMLFFTLFSTCAAFFHAASWGKTVCFSYDY